MNNELPADRVLIQSDLNGLSQEELIKYYKDVCESVGLNPLTKPFDYIYLDSPNGGEKRLTLYAKRDATDQLRRVHNVSIKIVSREFVDGIYVVTAQARLPSGREDESIGAVPLVKEEGEWVRGNTGKNFFKGTGVFKPLPPETRSNKIMTCETKSKRRVTLSICGLGMLDETEVDSITQAAAPPPPAEPPKPEAPKQAITIQPTRPATVTVQGGDKPVVVEGKPLNPGESRTFVSSGTTNQPKWVEKPHNKEPENPMELTDDDVPAANSEETQDAEILQQRARRDRYAAAVALVPGSKPFTFDEFIQGYSTGEKRTPELEKEALDALHQALKNQNGENIRQALLEMPAALGLNLKNGKALPKTKAQKAMTQLVNKCLLAREISAADFKKVAQEAKLGECSEEDQTRWLTIYFHSPNAFWLKQEADKLGKTAKQAMDWLKAEINGLGVDGDFTLDTPHEIAVQAVQAIVDVVSASQEQQHAASGD